MDKMEDIVVDAMKAIDKKFSVPAAGPMIRKFETGATRNLDQDKYDYEAFMCPMVIERYAEYMHSNRKQADGTYRDGDNWQKGIPLDAYMKSNWRHMMDLWKLHRRLPAAETIEMALCAILFNTMGYLHEHLKKQRTIKVPQADKEKTVGETTNTPGAAITSRCL